MTVYLIADVKITDDSWVPEYTVNVQVTPRSARFSISLAL